MYKNKKELWKVGETHAKWVLGEKDFHDRSGWVRIDCVNSYINGYNSNKQYFNLITILFSKNNRHLLN